MVWDVKDIPIRIRICVVRYDTLAASRIQSDRLRSEYRNYADPVRFRSQEPMCRRSETCLVKTNVGDPMYVDNTCLFTGT